VATITDWQVQDGLARCRADLTKTNPEAKCRQWLREFVWLANRHLIVLDVVETAQPEVRRQWQLHCATRPQLGDRLLTVTNRPPDKAWAVPELRPKNEEARLFCQVLWPKEYTLVLHDGGKAEAFDPAGQSKGPVEGNPYHLKFGKKVMQLDPGQKAARTVFLCVLTATETSQTTPPKTTCRLVKPGQLEVTVAGASATLAVQEWAKE
jgi:hypothetical protein